MWEHQNFAQFYCISVTDFSTVSECILFGNYMNKKNVFFAFLWWFLCLHAMYLEKSPVDFLREVFAVCPVLVTRSETWTKTVDVFIRSLKKRYALYTAVCGITGSEIECRFSGVNAVVVYKHLWSLERILVRNSQKKLSRKMPSNVKNIPPQNEAEFVPFRMRYGANGLLTGRSFTSQ